MVRYLWRKLEGALNPRHTHGDVASHSFRGKFRTRPQSGLIKLDEQLGLHLYRLGKPNQLQLGSRLRRSNRRNQVDDSVVEQFGSYPANPFQARDGVSVR